MARQKFEDTFRKKLGEREIQPSAQGWERLDKKLDNTGETRKFPVWWAGVAATVVGGLLIAGLVFNKTEHPGEPVIVDLPQEETLPKTYISQPVVVEEKVNYPAAVEAVASGPGNKKDANSTPAPPVPVKEGSREVENKELEAIADAGHNSPIKNLNEEQLINRKLDDILAEVNEQVAVGDELSLSEIDALLLKATAEISREKNQRFTTGRIDAGSLLFEVEMELEQSFRDRVFDMLKEGYLKARTAVANRSYP